MKFIKKLMYIILVLLALGCAFVLVCSFNPDITKKVAALLYPEMQELAEAAEDNLDTGQGQDVVKDTIQEPETPFYVPERADQEHIWDADEPDIMDTSNSNSIAETVTSGYILPDRDNIVIPENVSGRNGYQEVQEEREQVDDETAAVLQSQLDVGNTGDGLEFDVLYYPYYAMLDEKGQHMYRQIYANANDVYSQFLPVEEMTAGQLRNIFSAVYNDHPELFWMDTAYACKYGKDGRCVEVDLRFNRTARDLENAQGTFESNAEIIISQAQGLSSDYEKEKYVHDELISRIAYNMGAEMNQSAYSALVNGQTVCAGYARAFQYILQQLGIPCYYCTGFAGESHAWNIVMLDGEFYNVDTTWDDTGDGTYDYFNKTDEDYAGNHIRQELSVYLPPCNGQSYRNLEREAEDNGLRSLADLGLTDEQVITDMEGYYKDCYEQMLQNGRGNYTFYNVIESEGLLAQWYQEYQLDNYRQAYMENAMIELGASSCEMEMEIEELQDKRFLIAHKFTVR